MKRFFCFIFVVLSSSLSPGEALVRQQAAIDVIVNRMYPTPREEGLISSLWRKSKMGVTRFAATVPSRFLYGLAVFGDICECLRQWDPYMSEDEDLAAGHVHFVNDLRSTNECIDETIEFAEVLLGIRVDEPRRRLNPMRGFLLQIPNHSRVIARHCPRNNQHRLVL